MTRIHGSIVLAIWLTLAACSHSPVFEKEITDGVDKNFDFTAWRNLPNARTGQKVQLGGRIVQTEAGSDEVIIITTQLPIVEHPVYGPKDNGRRSGEFAVFYRGRLDPKWLIPGNRLIVVGTTAQAKAVVVDDVKRSLPTLTARCLHIWKTVGKEIAEFPYNIGGGYEPLERETFCASR
ncbi:MAG TPA: Slp family lipoprotein [Nitrospiraceae bacterium]|nr:Slp family lipoprotein [Nitrospiraceae bacterium]